ncbi:MAG: hypothetical protein KA397_07675 [Paludibacteraceae bacterium]|jgi:hypothetical protein|nr:hypothetical protein [Paludibacteraceae bacterium]
MIKLKRKARYGHGYTLTVENVSISFEDECNTMGLKDVRDIDIPEAIEAAIYYVSKKARSKGILYARYQQELETLSIWKRSQQSLQKSWLENIEKQFNEQMKLRKAA